MNPCLFPHFQQQMSNTAMKKQSTINEQFFKFAHL